MTSKTLFQIYSCSNDSSNDSSNDFYNSSINSYKNKTLIERDNFILLNNNFKKYSEKYPKDLFKIYQKMELKFNFEYIMFLSSEELNFFLEVNEIILGSLCHKYSVITELINKNMFDILTIKTNKDFNLNYYSEIENNLVLNNTVSLEEMIKLMIPEDLDKTNFTYILKKLKILKEPLEYVTQILRIIKHHGKIYSSNIKNFFRYFEGISIDKLTSFVDFFEKIKINTKNLSDILIVFKQLNNISNYFMLFLLNRYKDTLYILSNYYYDSYHISLLNINLEDEEINEFFSIFPNEKHQDISFLDKISNKHKEQLIINVKLYKKFNHLGENIFPFFGLLYSYNKSYEELEKMLLYSQLFINNNDHIIKVQDIFKAILNLNDIKIPFPFHYIRNLNNLESGNVEIKIARALLFLNHPNVYHENIIRDTLHILSLEPEVELVEYFMNLNTNSNEIYAKPLNVHSGNRDIKTIYALKELIKTWNPSNKDIDKYFKKFWKARKNLNKMQKEAFFRVLGVDDNLEPLERNNNDFGGLLTSKVIIGDIEMDSKEFIARFWRFAVKSDESENLKISIMMSIINSLQGETENKYVVCNPGKIQQLVVAVLQGRLVDSEGKIIDIESEDFEKIENDEKITDLNIIHLHIQPFISWIFGLKELIPKNISEFLEGLFKYLFEIKHINLALEKVIYYVIMISFDKNGIVINENLSITSSFEDMFQVQDYLILYGDKDRENLKNNKD